MDMDTILDNPTTSLRLLGVPDSLNSLSTLSYSDTSAEIDRQIGRQVAIKQLTIEKPPSHCLLILTSHLFHCFRPVITCLFRVAHSVRRFLTHVFNKLCQICGQQSGTSFFPHYDGGKGHVWGRRKFIYSYGRDGGGKKKKQKKTMLLSLTNLTSFR